MFVASLELCKELYELSGWNDAKELRQEIYFDHDSLVNNAYTVCRYDLGYLLRKLPNKLDGPINYWFSLSVGNSGEWLTLYDGTTHLALADTPENAVCQLAIELIKAGVLPSKGGE